MCGRRTIALSMCTQQEYFVAHGEKEHLQIGRIPVISFAAGADEKLPFCSSDADILSLRDPEIGDFAFNDIIGKRFRSRNGLNLRNVPQIDVDLKFWLFDVRLVLFDIEI